MKTKKVVKVFESVFDILYLITAICLSIYFITTNDKNIFYCFYGMMGLLLAFGDCFHLIPRIISLTCEKTELIVFALGVGKSITSISITLFYLLLIYFYTGYYSKELSIPITFLIWLLVIIRIVLCLYPMKQWITEDDNINFNILRNIPFFLLGGIAMMLFFNIERTTNTSFSLMWIAILLSFIFYFPVVIFSEKNPKLEMFMIPKTLMYLWILFMGIGM